MVGGAHKRQEINGKKQNCGLFLCRYIYFRYLCPRFLRGRYGARGLGLTTDNICVDIKKGALLKWLQPFIYFYNTFILKSFEELGVCEEIRRAIDELGFEHPMPVQEEVIPYLLNSGKDVIALAQTGTGKTAAFGIPVLQQIDRESRNTQALILSPTRELCLQLFVLFHPQFEGFHI